MAKHEATVRWTSDGNFRAGTYSRAHQLHFDGGAMVPGSSSPSVVPLPFSDPAAVDPEEMLIASASACHMLWFLSIAQEAGFDIGSYVDTAEGVMRRDDRGKLAITTIILRPNIVFDGDVPDAAAIERLHHEAHQRCFIANSLRSEIRVEPPQSSPID